MKLLSKITLTSVVIGGVSAGLYAAPSDKAEVPSGQAAPAPAAGGPRMSAAQMNEKVRLLGERVVGDYRLVVYMQQQARKQKDVIRLNCVNDKLIQIKPFQNLFDLDRDTFKSVEDDDRRYSLVDGMNQQAESVRRLREEADRCAGEPALAGESSNGWQGPQVPDNPFQDPFGDGLEPPAYASPYN